MTDTGRLLRGTNNDDNTDSSTNNIISEISNITIIAMAVLFFGVMVGCFLRACYNPQPNTKPDTKADQTGGLRETLLQSGPLPTVPEHKAVTPK